jgi:CheY-like chemotaxis protein
MSELHHKLHVLIVEDEPGDAQLMQLALRQSGFEIVSHTVGDGLEALRFLHRESAPFSEAPRPELILLDLKMPGQGGLDFLAEIKKDEFLRSIAVVVVTSSAADADVVASYQLGAAGYVQKPTDINEFIAAIERLCHYWFRLVRLPAKPQ